MTEEKLPDEKLDQEIEKQEEQARNDDPTGPAPDPLESGEEEQREVDQEKVNQSKDDAIRDERKKRKEAEGRENDKQEKIDTLRQEREDTKSPPKPKRDYTKGESVRNDFLEQKARTLLVEFKQDNPDAADLAPVIKKILFEEKQFLLDKGKEGFDMAVEIARGRIPQPEKKSAQTKPQTSTPQPGGKQQPENLNPPVLTEKEEKEISSKELKKRENEAIRKYRDKAGV